MQFRREEQAHCESVAAEHRTRQEQWAELQVIYERVGDAEKAPGEHYILLLITMAPGVPAAVVAAAEQPPGVQ